MTPEERAAELLKSFVFDSYRRGDGVVVSARFANSSEMIQAIAQAIREAKAEAYEEAAQAAENQLGVSGYAYAEDEHELIARYIRSLKDSLVPVSS
jgi:hypothetical protein